MSRARGELVEKAGSPSFPHQEPAQ